MSDITRYCVISEGMSDPPTAHESPTGDWVDYFDYIENDKALTELNKKLTDTLQEILSICNESLGPNEDGSKMLLIRRLIAENTNITR